MNGNKHNMCKQVESPWSCCCCCCSCCCCCCWMVGCLDGWLLGWMDGWMWVSDGLLTAGVCQNAIDWSGDPFGSATCSVGDDMMVSGLACSDAGNGHVAFRLGSGCFVALARGWRFVSLGTMRDEDLTCRFLSRNGITITAILRSCFFCYPCQLMLQLATTLLRGERGFLCQMKVHGLLAFKLLKQDPNWIIRGYK